MHEAVGLDTVLFVGVLSGDPLVAKRQLYPEARRWADRRLDAPTRAALERVDRVVRRDGKSITTAFLALFFSAGPVETVDDVLASARTPDPLLRRLESTLFWDSENTARYRKIATDVKIVIEALNAMGFQAFYREKQLSNVRSRVKQLQAFLSAYDIVPLQQKLLGRRLDPVIEVLVTAFNMPYGIRITGQRFITHYHFPDRVTLFTAAHEMFHPPFNLQNKALQEALKPLADDPWMKNVVEKHDPAYGYRTFRGVVNEDSTRALDQIVNEQIGTARPMGDRVREDDGGMHVLSAALYHLMKETGYAERGGHYESWLLDVAQRGLLRPEEVRRRAELVAGREAVQRWYRPDESNPPSASHKKYDHKP